MTTLAKLHSVPPSSVGLQSFGKPSGFYNRQLATFGAISASQSKAVDIETHKPVGQLPHYDDMIAFFSDPKSQPKDRGTFVHGDYKIDNMVFHKTEARVIGILDWEMATIGHPLSDLANLTGPYVQASSPVKIGGAPDSTPFLPGKTPGLPSREQVLAWYAEVAGWDPRAEISWGDAFAGLRNSIIMQGIAARFALRQASSERAHEYAASMGPYSHYSWSLCQKAKEKLGGGAPTAKL